MSGKCSPAPTSFDGNVSAWDVSGVTDMSGMFAGATSFDGNLSAWDVSGVTDMSAMFGYHHFLQRRHLPVGRLGRDWHVPNVRQCRLLQRRHL